jgi:hypothetical protein
LDAPYWFIGPEQGQPAKKTMISNGDFKRGLLRKSGGVTIEQIMMEEQLGVRLESDTQPVDHYIITRIEKPLRNKTPKRTR